MLDLQRGRFAPPQPRVGEEQHKRDVASRSIRQRLYLAVSEVAPSKVMAKLAEYTNAGWNDNLDFRSAAPGVVALA